MSRAEAIVARARDLIDGYRPRSFVDASDVPEVLEWSGAVRPTLVPPAPEPEPGTTSNRQDAGLMKVEEVEELFEARVQAVLLIRCGRCARRHFEPQDAPRERYYRCKCRAWNALPGRES
jgi:hypothetical protein